MTNHKREITKEQYERGVKNAGYLTREDEKSVFSASELLGYGVYGDVVRKEEDGYYVYFSLGSSCD